MTQYKLSSEHIAKIDQLANDLLRAFDWLGTPEGVEFWDDVHRKLTDKVKHGTTDGKPWVEPELTDEDAKQRPWVKVKDSEEQSWPNFLARLVYVKPVGCSLRFVAEYPRGDHPSMAWGYCRRATPEEIEAANAERQ